MNTSSRRLNAALASICLALAAVVLAAPAGAATTVHFQKESLSAYEGQLRRGEIHAVVFHPASPTGHLHISLNNHLHFTAVYASSEQGRLVAEAEAAHARLDVLPVAAKPAVKHKLRYIAGGILIVVIVVVLVVLLIGRRRALAERQ